VTDAVICPKCGHPTRPGCNGHGYVEVDELTNTLCPNFRAILISRRLGPELWNVRHAPSSPLFQMETGKEPTVDLTGKNLFLRCPWPNLLPHLKYALGCKVLGNSTTPPLRFTIITDQQIKNVYVGNERYNQRSFREREDRPTLNSLTDLVTDYDLVIIKLGYIGHQNKAAAGALKETLLIRAAMNKPVWLVEDPRHPWNYSHDPDVGDYISTRFKDVPITPADPGEDYVDPEDNLGMETTDFESSVASEPEEESRQEEHHEEAQDEPGRDEDGDMAMPFSSGKPKRGPNRKWKERS